MTSSADWTDVRSVTEKMPAAVLACGEQIEINSLVDIDWQADRFVEGASRSVSIFISVLPTSGPAVGERR